MVAMNAQISGFEQETEQRDILKLSHGTAVVLLLSEFRLLSKRPRPKWSIDKVTAFQSTSRISISNCFPTRIYTMAKRHRNLRRSCTLLTLGQVRKRGQGNSSS